MKTLRPELILRIGAGICFIGHGSLALMASPKFIGLLASFGIEGDLAVNSLLGIGILDVLVGLAILFKPNVYVLGWATLWTTMTIIAWGIHGDGIMDLFRRVPYVALPAGVLMIIFTEKRNALSHAETKQRTAMSDLEVGEKRISAKQERAIYEMDLSMICMKLQDKREGEGWTEQQCIEVADEYRKYLKMNLMFPEATIVPNLAIDTMWHYHILDTQAYYQDCQAIFGHILHHYPYFGMVGDGSNETEFVSAFDKTKMLYHQLFGTPMEGPQYLPSFQG